MSQRDRGIYHQITFEFCGDDIFYDRLEIEGAHTDSFIGTLKRRERKNLPVVVFDSTECEYRVSAVIILLLCTRT